MASLVITCYFTTTELEMSSGFKTPNVIITKVFFSAIDSASWFHLKLALCVLVFLFTF